MTNWAEMTVNEVFDEEHKDLEGRTLGAIAAERATDPFDLLFDLALSEGLRTSYMPQIGGQTDDASWKMRGEAWHDPRTIIGASDAGAHLDTIDTFAFTTQLLGRGVREKGLIELEEAVHQITDVPARLYGLRERGRLEPGWHADVVVFDEQRIAKGHTYTRFDLPAGAGRLYADAEGIDHVLVGGRRDRVRHGVDRRAARPRTALGDAIPRRWRWAPEPRSQRVHISRRATDTASCVAISFRQSSSCLGASWERRSSPPPG